MGQQRRENPGHPQGKEPDQLADAFPSQVCMEERGLVTVCALLISVHRKDTNLPTSVVRSALMSPKRAPTARPGRDRFTAESYTVLGENTHW